MPDELLLDGQPFDRRTARDHGVNGEQLRRLLLAGSVRRVLNDVYVDARAPDDLAFRARCLRLKLPRGAALSRLTAAWLFGIELTLLSAARRPDACRVHRPSRARTPQPCRRPVVCGASGRRRRPGLRGRPPVHVARTDGRRPAPLAAAARGSGDRRRDVSSRRDPGARAPGRGGALHGRTRRCPGPVSRGDRRTPHRVPGRVLDQAPPRRRRLPPPRGADRGSGRRQRPALPARHGLAWSAGRCGVRRGGVPRGAASSAGTTSAGGTTFAAGSVGPFSASARARFWGRRWCWSGRWVRCSVSSRGSLADGGDQMRGRDGRECRRRALAADGP